MLFYTVFVDILRKLDNDPFNNDLHFLRMNHAHAVIAHNSYQFKCTSTEALIRLGFPQVNGK